MAGDQDEAAAALRRGWSLLTADDDVSAAKAERLGKATLALIRAQEALDAMNRSKAKHGPADDGELEQLKAKLLERLDRLAARLET